MTYLNVKKVHEADTGGATIGSADSTYGTDSESLQAVSEIVNAIDMLEEYEALVIWKVIL